MTARQDRTCFPPALALVAALAACEQPTGVGHDIIAADQLEVRLGGIGNPTAIFEISGRGCLGKLVPRALTAGGGS
jgi:hypothetical protein